jgi:LacI family transcriptional regulator
MKRVHYTIIPSRHLRNHGEYQAKYNTSFKHVCIADADNFCYHVRMAHETKKRRIAVALWMNGTSGRDILSGIFRYAKTRIGWDVRLIQLPNATHPERIRRLAAQGIDGLIASDLSNVALKEIVTRTDVPVVFIGPPTLPIPRPSGGKTSFVSCDDIAIGAMGAKHFLSLGAFNGFGFLFAGKDPRWPNLREQGFRDTLAAAGKTCCTFRSPTAADERIDEDDLAAWLKSLPKPTAVMTFYDPYAVQVVNVCREQGISVPGQVSVLGVDNDGLLCEFADPPLSSIQPDHERAGLLAARELHALMSNPERKPCTLVSPVIGIVERESTRPLAPSAHLIRKALGFINANAAKGISVKDVVAHLKISRRLADLRFREIEGRSILQTIEARRLELAERALQETNRPVTAVARESGYRNVKTFEAAFRRKHGISPSVFRKR